MTQTLPELLAAPLDPDRCEASAYPWWFILDPRAITGRPMSAETAINAVGMSVVTGPFFPREAATEFLTRTRYNFGKDAVVWCASGIHSRQYRDLLALAKKEAEVVEALRKGNPESKKIPGFTHAEEEYADAIIRIMDTTAAAGMRISEAILAKMAYNATREPLHGKKF